MNAEADERKKPRAVVIGASAGGLDALSSILPSLPADFPLPIMIVTHFPPDRESLLASLLDARCAISVKEAEDKEDLRPGTAYVAPPNYHLLVDPEFYLSLSSDEPVLYSRPSIDVLFESAADAFGDELIGVVLTGANSDGARGLRAVGRAGGVAIVQSPENAEAPAMPCAACEAWPAARVLPLSEIANALIGEVLAC